ncbi:MAG: leucine-rich repeat domain-containing protein [Bacteroidia bacterium]
MKKNIPSVVKLQFLFLLFFGCFSAIAQEDRSYIKLSNPAYKEIPNHHTPVSKYGNTVTFANLEIALKNPDAYFAANFYNSALTEVPEEIFLFPNLREIDLSHNSISVLPDKFKELQKLKELHLADNKITYVGSEITSCRSLEVLQLRNNPLKTVSKEIGQMSSLKELWIENTDPSCVLPQEIWNLNNIQKLRLMSANLTFIPSAISEFSMLDEICLSGNVITAIPDEIYSLKSLTYLNLGNNKITTISSLVKNLEHLDYLGVYGNPVSQLPDEIASLKELSFLSCWFTNLPNSEIEKAKAALPQAEVHAINTDLH